MGYDINQIDWINLGNSRIPIWLREAKSEDEAIRRKALQELNDAVAPWELLDGYGSSSALMAIAESRIPEAVIPFLIDLLNNENTKDKHLILYILFELSRYEDVNDVFIPLLKKESYNVWATRIRETIKTEIELLRGFLSSEFPEVRLVASDLVAILTDQT